jgi:hypothetical protein
MRSIQSLLKTYWAMIVVIITLLPAFSSCSNFSDKLTDALSGASKSMTLDGNSLYHQSEEIKLAVGSLEIAGEVEAPGLVALKNYYKREVYLKEALFDPDSGIVFTGAYRYRGYSLFDLLHPFVQQKKNMETFRPAIDLYLIVENDKGEKVSFSWSEVFHTTNPHQVLIATEVAPIKPYRREVDYPVGNTWKLVNAGDLFAFRTLENPVKITVLSFDEKEYTIVRDLQPMYSEAISVVSGQAFVGEMEIASDSTQWLKYHTSFYGMGMGNHGNKYFEGPRLIDVMPGGFDPFDANMNRHGLVCMAGIDGYRAIFSFSELFNRVDQVFPILAIPPDTLDGGYYRMFHPVDFYADRSVKSLAEMYFFMK